MRKPLAICVLACLMFALIGCEPSETSSTSPSQPEVPATASVQPGTASTRPAIASWLAKKEQLIASKKPYCMVMAGWFTPEEASQIKSINPDAILLAGLSVNFTWDNADWMSFLLTVANYGNDTPVAITEDMYLHTSDGERCAFGWASEDWGHEEIYAMDPGNREWVQLITSFYKTVLEQPQHHGIIIDMVLNKSLFPDAISDREWAESTRRIMAGLKELNTQDKLVVLNSGRDFSEIDAYAEFMDGFVMENFMGAQVGSTFDDGLHAAELGYMVVYAVDTDDTGQQDLKKMRMGFVLGLLTDNTWFTYDFGPRDHGQAWWFPEYDVELGNPLGSYHQKGEAYYREFEHGVVVAAPYSDTTVTLDTPHTDATSGEQGTEFQIEVGDGRLYVSGG